MPSVSTETLEGLGLLAQEHRIKFAGDLPPSKWPRCHKSTLEGAKALGERKLDSYATESNVSSDEPWKVQVKSQAAILVEKSKRCRQRNESSWRFACEPLIFVRLEAEVVWYSPDPFRYSLAANGFEVRIVGREYGAPKLRQAEKKHPKQQRHCGSDNGVGSRAGAHGQHEARISTCLNPSLSREKGKRAVQISSCTNHFKVLRQLG